MNLNCEFINVPKKISNLDSLSSFFFFYKNNNLFEHFFPLITLECLLYLLFNRSNYLRTMSRSLKENYNKLIAAEAALDQMLSEKKYVQVNLLHQYNDIKDAAQVVINHIANLEETTVTEVHKRLQLKE